jgi:hypothetical protein
VNHYCVSASSFDYQTTIQQLERTGAKIEASDVAGSPQFRDPDGYLIQVMTR